MLLTELAGQWFEWGRGSQVAANELRARYIADELTRWLCGRLTAHGYRD